MQILLKHIKTSPLPYGMNQESIVAVSLSSSFIGLFLLFVVFLFTDPQELSVSEIADTEFKDVKIKGTVMGIKKFDATTILEVAEIKSVDVVVFDKRTLPQINETTTITGEVRDYKGRKQLIAESIKTS